MEDDLLVYPMGKVVAIAPDQDTLDAVGEALGAQGIADSRIEVLSGQSGADRLDPRGEKRGPFATALRVVQKAFGEETVRLERLNDAVESGQYVVQVDLPEEDEGDDAFDEEKYAIGRALHGAGATNVAYYGKLAIEELQIGA